MIALVGVELETLVSEPDALTTRPPPCAQFYCVNVVWWLYFIYCVDLTPSLTNASREKKAFCLTVLSAIFTSSKSQWFCYD